MPAPLVASLEGVWLPTTGRHPIPVIHLRAGTDARLRMTVYEGTVAADAEKDITGCTAKMVAGHEDWLAAREGTITDAAGGVVEWTLTAAETSDVAAFSYPLEFTLTDAGGYKQVIAGPGFLSLLPSTEAT